MQLALARLPLSAEHLAELARQGYAIVDQAAATPGLLIVQGPDADAPPPASAAGASTDGAGTDGHDAAPD